MTFQSAPPASSTQPSPPEPWSRGRAGHRHHPHHHGPGISGPRSWLKEQTVHELEVALDPARFVRVHRSYVIQGARLARIEPVSKEARVAVLTTGARIPISESGLRRLQAWLAGAHRG